MTQDNPHKSNEGSDGDNQPAANKNEIALAIDSLKEEYAAAQTSSNQHEQKILRWTRAAGIGVSIYTLITVCLAVIAYSALRTAEDTEQRQLRAYAYVAPEPPLLQEGKPIDLTFAIKALGATLAYDVQTTINAGVSGGGRLQSDTIPADRCVDFATVLDPTTKDGRKVHLPVSTFRTTKDNLISLQSPTTRLYVWGETRYRDTFKCQHWATYCYQIGDTPLHTEECADHNRNAVDESGPCETSRISPPVAPNTPACQRAQ
jgi:hypothetical protein